MESDAFQVAGRKSVGKMLEDVGGGKREQAKSRSCVRVCLSQTHYPFSMRVRNRQRHVTEIP